MGDIQAPISNEEALKLCGAKDPSTQVIIFHYNLVEIYIKIILLQEFIFQQTMYRIKDPRKTIPFYTGVLGMKLLQKLDFPSMKFSLYFMGFEDELVGELGTKERSQWAFSRKATLELTQSVFISIH